MKKQFFYPMRNPNDPSHVEKIPITEEIYNSIYPNIWRTLQRMQRSGQCACPKPMLWKCDADCIICPYHANGNTVSIYTPIEDTDLLTIIDTIASDEPSPESVAIDKALLEALLEELDNLGPKGKRICQLVALNYSEREAASIMGISKTTFRYQWIKIRDQLAEKLKDYK